MATDKDTIYIDIDDEITGIIDKLRASNGKVVALVLPKRAAVFQSIVNMKLLKRASDTAKKNLVLITNEAGLLPLAGAAGVHVAKTLTSKPEIPLAPQLTDDSEEMVEESEADAGPVDPHKPVGELVGAKAPLSDQGVETLMLDDEDLPPEDTVDKPKPKSFAPPPKKNKKLKIPNFERFRLLLALGVLLLILLIAAIIFATVALPKATINIKTDATNVDTNLSLNLSTAATTLSPGSTTVPAKLEQTQKTYTQQVPTTGQKNNGNKASGSVVFYNCDLNDVQAGQNQTIPAGTGISNNGQTYITQQSVDVPPSHFKGGQCKSDQPSSGVNVIAQNPGASYNISGNSTFSVSFANPSDGTNSFSATTPNGISGGTDNIVQSVNQNDINGAKAKITTSDSSVKQYLDSQLNQAGYYPIDATYSASTPSFTNSANVGDIATTVTVTETVSYTMFGVHQSDLKSLVDANIDTQIDTSKQSILDDGLSKAAFNVTSLSANGAALSLSTTATAGPQLDTNSIKTAAAGQQAGAIKGQLTNNPDVTSVDVKFSPFWVTTAPKKTNRITVNIAKPTTTINTNH